MKFVNYIIKLPDTQEKVEIQENEENLKKNEVSLEEYFRQDMNLLFRKVYQEEEMEKMKRVYKNFDQEKIA